MSSQQSPLPLMIPAVALSVVWSCVGSTDLAVWAFEVVPGLIAISVLMVLHRRFRFATVIYVVAVIHFLVLAIGGRYTYAETPIGFWMQDLLGLERNPFDRVGHFMQGFTPALVARELLLRTTKLERGGWMRFIVVSICLAFSALYEVLEWWWVILFYPDTGTAWLGHQGDPFDAQADMMMAVLGACLALLLLSRLQDRQMSVLSGIEHATEADPQTGAPARKK